MSKTDDLKRELQAHLTAARDIAETAEKEDREYTDEERSQLTELMGKAGEVRERFKKAQGDQAVRKAIAELGDDIGLDEPGQKQTPSGLIVPDGKSIGEHFVTSAEYGNLMSTVPGGVFQKNHRVQSRPVGYQQMLSRKGQKALVTGASDTSAGAFVQNQWLGLQVGLEPFQRPLMLRDLVTQGSTTSDTVEYVRVTGITNNAAPVAEATTSAAPTQDGSTGPLIQAAGGGYKPESGLATAKVTTPVRTIAHWIPVTKRALSDAAQMRTLIDAFLDYGLEEELEDQMIAGDGTGENFDGIGNVSGVQAQAWDTNHLITLRKAKTLVRTVGRAVPNGYVLNPADVEALDLLTDNEARFYFGGPQQSGLPGPAPLWGLPVIESEAVPSGTGYVGDWRRAVLWDREQASISVTDSHLDYYIRNLVAILAELRAAFGVLQPSAFVEVDLTS